MSKGKDSISVATEGAPLQVVFVLTSSGSNPYLHMARLAMASVRESNPGMPIVLLSDTATMEDAAFKASGVAQLADRAVACATPAGDVAYRSRFIKTSMRSLVQGTILFLDLDLLVRGDLEPLLEVEGELAGAVNYARSGIDQQVDPMNEEILATMGWKRGSDYYINTGVLLLRDTAAVHLACADWHQRWSDCFAITGKHFDQPAFNAMLHAVGPPFAVLHTRYNAQVRPTPGTAEGAVIWHYYMSARLDERFAFGAELRRLVQGARLDVRRVQSLIRAPHPWRREHPLDDFWAKRVVDAGGYMPELESRWFSGDRWGAWKTYYRKYGLAEVRAWFGGKLPPGLLGMYRKMRG